jgi:Domain of unknown function (DUF4845)
MQADRHSTLPQRHSATRQAPTNRAARRRHQRGITLFGLIFWAIVVSFVAYVGLRVVPTINEYLTIQRTVDKVAASSATTVPEIRAAFDRYKDVEYAITSVTANDLQITKQNDRVVISFAYEKEVPLGGPVFLLLKYQGRSK